MRDKEISDLLADGKMTVKNMWIMAYDSKTGKKGWISMDSIISDIVESFEKDDVKSTKSVPVCKCGHPITHHDSEDGDCMEHIHDHNISCPCGNYVKDTKEVTKNES